MKNISVSGLHKVGSDAVNHYTNMTLQDRFQLMSVAFQQPLYRVDSELNEIIDLKSLNIKPITKKCTIQEQVLSLQSQTILIR